MSSEELIDLMGKGPATRYVLYKGLSDNWVLFYKNSIATQLKYNIMRGYRVVGDMIELSFMIKLDYKPDRFKYIVKDNILSDESEEIYKGKYEQVMAVFWWLKLLWEVL